MCVITIAILFASFAWRTATYGDVVRTISGQGQNGDNSELTTARIC
jgi:hypothetical protein